MKAECQCGQLTADLAARPLITIACHCVACQRRTGAPFGVTAYCRGDQVTVKGEATRYTRSSEDGNAVETFFCPICGSTVYARLARRPELIGIPVGVIADPALPAPAWSVWEQSRHHWIAMPDNTQHFDQHPPV